MDAGFTILEHPSDVGIEARGATLARAFEEAAAGLISIILDRSAIRPLESRTVSLTASDPEQLLVQWLSEVLYLYDGLHFAAGEFAITELGPSSLRATVRGEQAIPARHQPKLDVKAVTYHQVSVKQDARWCVVRVFLDI